MATPLPTISKPKVAKPPYVPTGQEREALAACVAALEGLNVQERGHVIARLGDMYHLQRAKPKKIIDRKAKAPWKEEWEKTPEYKMWQAAKLPKDAPKNSEQIVSYQALQQAAIGKRTEVKSRFLVAGKAMPSPSQNNSAFPSQEDGKTDE